jgi:hypothetical protein
MVIGDAWEHLQQTIFAFNREFSHGDGSVEVVEISK